MTRIFIVDDHAIFTQALKLLLGGKQDFEVVGTATHPQVAFDAIKTKAVDVILLDLRMGQDRMNGIQALDYLKEYHPAIKVIILTMFNQGEIINEAIEKDADGFLLKGSDPAQLEQAIKRVMTGSTYFSPEALESLVQFKYRKMQLDVSLTPREKEVLQLVVDGLNTQEISNTLHIGPAGVETHRRNLRHKFEVSNTAGLVREAIVGKYVII